MFATTGSSSLSLPPHRRKVTGSILGGGTQYLLLMVTVLSPRLVIEMLPVLKCKKTIHFIKVTEQKILHIILNVQVYSVLIGCKSK